MSLTIWQFSRSKKAHAHLQSLRGVEKRFATWPGNVVGDGAAYGVMHGAVDAWRATREAGYHWLYMDGPYWLERKHQAFRLTWDQMWFNGNYGSRRKGDLKGAGCVLRPWKQGDDVIVAPNNHMIYRHALGGDVDEWTRSTVGTLGRHTDRKIVVRKKKANGDIPSRVKSMDACFANAWAVVTSGSSIGVEAVCRGVPVFSTVPCAASPVALSDLSRIEDPWMPDDREAWAENLAARQFSIAQIQSGEAWRVCEEDLQEMAA